MRQRLKRIRWIRWVLILCLVLILWLFSLAIDIYAYSSVSDTSSADAAIVLGAAAWGEQPSPVFEERIKHAIDLYKAGRVNAIIFTGGIGEGEQIAESIVASDYAIKHGVAGRDVFCETLSNFTYENLRGAKAIIQQQHFGKVLVVSDPLHMRRAMTMAQDLGLDAYSSPTPTSRYISLQSKIEFLWGEVRYYATYLVRRPFMDKSPEYSAVHPCR
jgi:uncharacterized SAM-binding protein YcdF (DUF218 family)